MDKAADILQTIRKLIILDNYEEDAQLQLPNTVRICLCAIIRVWRDLTVITFVYSNYVLLGCIMVCVWQF